MPTALHRIQFRWGNGLALDLEWTKGRGVAAALPDLPEAIAFVEAEAEPDAASIQGVPAICYRADTPALFEPLQLRENTDYFIDITLPISRDAAEAEIQAQPGWPFDPRLAGIFQVEPPRRWRSDSDGLLVVSGTIRLRNHAGVLDLRTPFGSGLRLEVVCQKIGYLDEFRLLLEHVADELAELLLQYDSPVSAGFNVSDVTSSNEAGLLFQLRNIMSPDNLPASIDEILARFKSRLYSRQSVVSLEEVEEPDIHSLAGELDATNLQPGGPLRRFFGGYTPRALPILEQIETTDTPENRYAKYFLEEVLQLSRRLRDRLGAVGKQASAREAGVWVDQLEEMLSSPSWVDVRQFRQFPSNSQVLQKGRGYRDILKYDLSLRMGLELPWKRAGQLAEGTYGDLRPVNELYEYWCFFVLRRALAEVCLREEPNRGTLISTSADGLRVSLQKGTRSKVSFVHSDGPGTRVDVNLFYNRRFRRPTRSMSAWLGSYTASFHPDYSVEVLVTREGSLERHWLHFDAKYRLDRGEVEALFEELPGLARSDEEAEGAYEAELTHLYKQDDLFKMHTYRDGILGSRGAYIMYPGDGAGAVLGGKRQNLFVRHPSAFDGAPVHMIPSVGAFSLAPLAEPTQSNALRKFLDDVLRNLGAKGHYQEETGNF